MTVTANVHKAEFPFKSVAVAVTMVVPTGNVPWDCVEVCKLLSMVHEYEILGDVSRPLKSAVASGKS